MTSLGSYLVGGVIVIALLTVLVALIEPLLPWLVALAVLVLLTAALFRQGS